MENLKTIDKAFEDEVTVAIKYFKIVCIAHDYKLSDLEINLVAFSAVKGSLSIHPVREEFLKRFDVHKGTMYNVISGLKSKGIMRMQDGKYSVNPGMLQMDFSKPVNILIKLKNESTAGQDS